MKYELTDTDLCLIENKRLIMSREGVEIRKAYLRNGKEISKKIIETYPWVGEMKKTYFSTFFFMGESVDSAKRLASIAQYLDTVIPISYKEFKEFKVAYADDFRAVYEDIRDEKLPWYSQIDPKIKNTVGFNIYGQIAEFLRENIITSDDLKKIYGNSRSFSITHKKFHIIVISDYVFFLNK